MDLFRFVTGSGDHELVFDVGAGFCQGGHHSDRVSQSTENQ